MTTRQLRVVIADETPMNRHLVRFFLEKDGIQVLAETARGDEVVSLAAELQPDAVVLDHTLTGTSGIDAIPLIREASPSTKIVLFSPSAGEPPIALPSRGADVYLEKDVGLKDLSFVLATLCGSPFIAVEEEAAAAPRKEEPAPRPAPRRRLVASLGAAAAAATLAIALVMFRTAPEAFRPPTTVPPPTVEPSAPPEGTTEGLAHLQAAMDDLDQLASVLAVGSARQIANLARDLLEERAAAVAAGIDVSKLDALIAERLSVSGLSPEIVLVLRAILGPLLPGPGGIFVLPEPPEQTGGGTGVGPVGAGTFTDTGGGGGGGGGGGTGGGGGGGGGGGTGGGDEGGDTDGGGGDEGGDTGGGGGDEGDGDSGDDDSGDDEGGDEDDDDEGGDEDEDEDGDPDNGNHGHDNGNHYGWDLGEGNPH